jgi:large subunit ribosomal protein L5
MVAQNKVVPRLKSVYQEKIISALKTEFNYANVMEIPKLEKVVVSIGLGEYIQNHKALEFAQNDLAKITGQKPIVIRAKKSIANFKLRKGMPIGLKVTLRGDQMYHFLDRLISLALPRIRDFRGVSNRAFDQRGNYTIGLKEQLIFPEISYDKIDKVRGMNITLVTTAKTNEESFALLKHFGMPFRK